jgi:hypothetical protein
MHRQRLLGAEGRAAADQVAGVAGGVLGLAGLHAAGADLDEAHVVIAMQRIGAVWEQLFPIEQQRITQLLIERIQLHGQGLDILWREDGWLGLGADIASHPLVEEMKESTEEAFA